MMKRPIKTLACVALATSFTSFLVVGHAQASPIVITYSVPDGVSAMAVDDLVVDGITYNVTFSTAPTASPIDGNLSAATDATNELVAALNAANALGVYVATVATQGLALFYVDYIPYDAFGYDLGYAEDFLAFDTINYSNSPPTVAWANDGLYLNYGSEEAYADFTQVITGPTPLPAALPLFATGLGGLGLLGWRRKRKAQAVA